MFNTLLKNATILKFLLGWHYLIFYCTVFCNLHVSLVLRNHSDVDKVIYPFICPQGSIRFPIQQKEEYLCDNKLFLTSGSILSELYVLILRSGTDWFYWCIHNVLVNIWYWKIFRNQQLKFHFQSFPYANCKHWNETSLY